MNKRKSLKELNLLDKFLFDEAMDDPENVKTMLDIILSQKTNLKHPPQTEKEQNTHNLPKRSRLYQGIIDSKLLSPGVTDFNLLNEVLIVLITSFDLFGYDLYRYTFQMRCEEVPELKLDDGATRIFLNTRGKHPELVSQELIELLKYMEHSTDEVSEQCKSERIQKMHRRVCRIKASEKTEVKYMQAWEEKLLERQKEKRELLRKMNHKMSIEEIADVLDMDVSEVKHIIEEQYDTED